jgi:BirA family biotin operon repressor/biotin-[acetyl-CoA-carboxylase] ligase
MLELDQRARAAGVRLVCHEHIASTNTEALSLGRQGERGPLWITAEHQSAGRGRRGRTWISEPGNLFATLLLTDPSPPEHWPELSFVAALAIHDAVVEVAPQIRPHLGIKWPNDLLLGGRKFAGILIEAESAGEGGSVAVGIGVNCTGHPGDAEFPATDLRTVGAEVSAALLFAAVSAKMVGRLAQWNQGEHFATIRTDWFARAAGVGERMRVRLPTREVVGQFEALDPSGRLVLLLPGGSREAVSSGDVVELAGSGWSMRRTRQDER